jgi:hypothetical protein
MVAGMAEAGQRHDEPLHEEDRRRHSLGHFGRDQPRGGSPPANEMMALMDRTPPRTGWTFSGADGSVLGLFGTCGRLQEPQGGQRFAPWMLILPKKGQHLPQRGLTSPF